jgi:hypothetical protein
VCHELDVWIVACAIAVAESETERARKRGSAEDRAVASECIYGTVTTRALLHPRHTTTEQGHKAGQPRQCLTASATTGGIPVVAATVSGSLPVELQVLPHDHETGDKARHPLDLY